MALKRAYGSLFSEPEAPAPKPPEEDELAGLGGQSSLQDEALDELGVSEINVGGIFDDSEARIEDSPSVDDASSLIDLGGLLDEEMPDEKIGDSLEQSMVVTDEPVGVEGLFSEEDDHDSDPLAALSAPSIDASVDENDSRPLDADDRVRAICASINLAAPLLAQANEPNDAVDLLAESVALIEADLVKRLVFGEADIPRHTFLRRTVAKQAAQIIAGHLNSGSEISCADVARQVIDGFDRLNSKEALLQFMQEEKGSNYDEAVSMTCSAIAAASELQNALKDRDALSDESFSVAMRLTWRAAQNLAQAHESVAATAASRATLVQSSVRHATDMVSRIITDIHLLTPKSLAESEGDLLAKVGQVNRAAHELIICGKGLLDNDRRIGVGLNISSEQDDPDAPRPSF